MSIQHVWCQKWYCFGGASGKFITLDNGKKHRVRYSVQPKSPQNHQTETLSPSDSGFLPWWFLRGFWLNRIPSDCGCCFCTVMSWIYIFMENYSYFHISTSNLFCLNVHLPCLSLDNHFLSKQPQWQCHVTMTWQWGHVTKQMLNLAGWGQIRRDQIEWFNHHLGVIRS